MSTDVTFFEHIPFSSSSGPTSQGEADDVLVYTITPPLAPVKPPITQTYFRRTQLPITVTPVQDPPAPCPDEPNSM